ncbi:MAG: hypothetical protein PHD65_04785 [Gallionella sp.]|nr:hypothetical protein [Gallionella sp.]
MPDIRSPSFAIASSTVSCWKCKEITPVISLFLPVEFEAYESDREEDCTFADDEEYQSWLDQDHPEMWQPRTRTAMLFYIETLIHETCEALADYKHYFLDYSQTSEDCYYMNHCHHCGMIQGDFFLHNEADAAFNPQYKESISKLSLSIIDQPISVTGSYNDSLDIFEYWDITIPSLCKPATTKTSTS